MVNNLANKHEIEVWNLPIRLFHWSMVCCFITAWSTLDSRYLDIHVFAGCTLLGLILFRILWGWIGGPYVRFSDFSFNWTQVKSHLRSVMAQKPHRYIGHNPAGSWAIYLLLTMSCAITLTGLMTLGGEEQHGPLAGILSFQIGDIAHSIHELLANLTLVAIAVHLMGVAIESLLLQENLVGTMLSGRKRASSNATPAQPHRKTAIAMLTILVLAGLYWFQGYLTDSAEQPYRPFIGPNLADNELWREECGDCHLAFHPSLLPARSWKRILRQQSHHFEEDLFLDAETITQLEAFLTNNAAEQAATEAAWKISHSIPKNESPIAITQTHFWKRQHHELPEAVWTSQEVQNKSHCAACHLDAEDGTFEDGAMHLPNGF